MQVAMTEAFKMGFSIEEADAVFGRPMGIPKTGVFGLYDLIGIDLMSDVLKSFLRELPKEDAYRIIFETTDHAYSPYLSFLETSSFKLTFSSIPRSIFLDGE